MAETESRKRVLAEPMAIGLLNEIAERLMSLENLYKEERAEGMVEPIEKFTITSQKVFLKRPKPWFSVVLINDGPFSVFVIVNTQKSFDEHEVLDHETYTVDMHRGRIDDILLWCNVGETAAVRLVGTR